MTRKLDPKKDLPALWPLCDYGNREVVREALQAYERLMQQRHAEAPKGGGLEAAIAEKRHHAQTVLNRLDMIARGEVKMP